MAVGIVDLTLLRIAQDAVGFGAFAEADFGFLFVVGIAIGMPLHGRFAVRGLDLLKGSGFGDAENFVKVALGLCHG